MNKLALTTLRYICGTMLIVGSLSANNEILDNQPIEQPTEQNDSSSSETSDSSTDKTRHPVGIRMMPYSEQIEIQEKRALTARMQIPEEVIGEQETNSNKIANSTEEEQVNKTEQKKPLESMFKKKSANGIAAIKTQLPQKETFAAYFYTTHAGAIHHPFAINVFGDKVELEDGSVWSVCYEDTYKVLNWLTSDTIVITPNHEWFSAYNYRLYNQNTGISVAVNLKLGPIYNGIFTHWIAAIDKYNNKLVLSDGSVWEMSGDDYSISKKWLPNDTIIIGINDGWLSSIRPNILINVTMLNYARGTCLH